MVDLDGKLEIFIITNGRATFPYCEESVLNQEQVKFKTTIHRDMKWLDANRRILDVCQSKFFARIDDDMILHPRAVRFMWECIQKQSKSN